MKCYARAFGLKFAGINIDEVKNVPEDWLKFVTTVNAEFIVEVCEGNERLKNIICNSCATIDGQVPYWIVRAVNSGMLIDKISGSDLIYDLIEEARIKKLRMFFLGGLESSNRLAVDVVRGKGVCCDGYSPEYSDYPFSHAWNNSVLAEIEKDKPQILIVCFGAVKQEFWIDDNKEFLFDAGVRYVVGAGGTVDFVSGIKKRAPKIVQRFGIEWIYRFIQEPKFFRFRRILRSSKIFFYLGSAHR